MGIFLRGRRTELIGSSECKDRPKFPGRRHRPMLGFSLLADAIGGLDTVDYVTADNNGLTAACSRIGDTPLQRVAPNSEQNSSHMAFMMPCEVGSVGSGPRTRHVGCSDERDGLL